MICGAEQHQDRFDDRHVDDLPVARRLGAAQRGGDGEARRQGGDAVGETERRQRRRTVGLAGERGEPAHRLGDGSEAGPPGVRAGLAERRHPGDHQRRVGGVELLGPEAPAFQRARAEVLDQHVGACRQPQQQRRPFWPRQVECHRPLVAPERLPPQPGAVTRGPVRARRVRLAPGARS